MALALLGHSKLRFCHVFLVCSQPRLSLYISIASIAFNPTAWNIVARNEYHNKTITRLLGGNAYLGCYFLAVCIFSAGYLGALLEQPRSALLPAPLDTLVPAALFLLGQTFVGFPFNVLRDPMYVGSTICFAATALWYERPAGLLITLYVYIVYNIALRFEGPFTDMIYSMRATASAKNVSKKKL
ncbi:phospholipid methyltransferase-domain-containing protein [Multifurca ochricompacta]|uniref:Phosphatidyl-N-methylethanolamine N-methyltransferase n=1 Tax=Multifurca ochricompacta TaxID=376703 RepID=A0AAD4QKT7_9AGAM|nr:phospholipid methyltransferase-domain-containing protein [Multifurca ochricompacta]